MTNIDRLERYIKWLADDKYMSDHEVNVVIDYLTNCFSDRIPLEHIESALRIETLQQALINLYHKYGFSVDLTYIEFLFTSDIVRILPNRCIFLIAYMFINDTYTEKDISHVMRLIFKRHNISQPMWTYITCSMDTYFAGDKMSSVTTFMDNEFSRQKLVNGDLDG